LGHSGCISLPGFPKLDATYPYRHCVYRKSKMKGKGSFFSPEQLGIIQAKRDYNKFRKALEGLPHNMIHAHLGGDMGIPTLSPNDPIFFLHHRNVDRLWVKWQKQNPTIAADYIGNFSPGKFANDVRLSDKMVMFGLGEDISVSNAMNTTGGTVNGLFCFDYSNSIKPITNVVERDVNETDTSIQRTNSRFDTTTPHFNDRSHLFNIRVPTILAEDFLKKWKLNAERIKHIRETEAEVKKFTEFVNQMPIEFSTSLEQHMAGQKNGWVSKTDEEQKAEDERIKSLVVAFEASQSKEQVV
jgi:hypothetical protein